MTPAQKADWTTAFFVLLVLSAFYAVSVPAALTWLGASMLYSLYPG